MSSTVEMLSLENNTTSLKSNQQFSSSATPSFSRGLRRSRSMDAVTASVGEVLPHKRANVNPSQESNVPSQNSLDVNSVTENSTRFPIIKVENGDGIFSETSHNREPHGSPEAVLLDCSGYVGVKEESTSPEMEATPEDLVSDPDCDSETSFSVVQQDALVEPNKNVIMPRKRLSEIMTSSMRTPPFTRRIDTVGDFEINGKEDASDMQGGNVTLWQFLLELLVGNHHPDIIQWTNLEGEFMLLQAEEVARLWGMRKNKNHRMNYDKLSRALRYYYQKNIIKKVHGHKFVYRFVYLPEEGIYSFQKSVGLQDHQYQQGSKENSILSVRIDTSDENVTDNKKTECKENGKVQFQEENTVLSPTSGATNQRNNSWSAYSKPEKVPNHHEVFSSYKKQESRPTHVLSPQPIDATISSSFFTPNFFPREEPIKRVLNEESLKSRDFLKNETTKPCCQCRCHTNDTNSETNPSSHQLWGSTDMSRQERNLSSPSLASSSSPSIAIPPAFPLSSYPLSSPSSMVIPNYSCQASNPGFESSLHTTRHAINMERLAQQIRLQSSRSKVSLDTPSHEPSSTSLFNSGSHQTPATVSHQQSSSVSASSTSSSGNVAHIPLPLPFHSRHSESLSSSPTAASPNPPMTRFYPPVSTPGIPPSFPIIPGVPPPPLPTHGNQQCVWMPVPVAMLSQWWTSFAAAVTANQKQTNNVTPGKDGDNCNGDEAINLT